MKYFDHESAETFEEAAALLKDSKKGRKVAMAGGSDLMGVLKEQILKEYPETVINIKTKLSSSKYRIPVSCIIWSVSCMVWQKPLPNISLWVILITK